MNTQTKAAIGRIKDLIDKGGFPNPERATDGVASIVLENRVLDDVLQLITALTSPIGELFCYSEWLDSQNIIRDDTEASDDRSHEQLVIDYLAEG